MAIPTTYATLKTAIASWLDGRSSLDNAADYIRMTEDACNYGYEGQFSISPLRTREMEDEVTLVSGALPSDFLEWRDIYTSSGGATYGLRPNTPGRLNYDYPTSYAGVGNDFAIVESTVRVRPSADASMIYYAKIPALSDANTTNWLLTKHPTLYVMGGVFFAALDVMDQEQIANKGTLFAGFIKGLNSADRQGRWARGVARVMGPTP